MFFMTPKKKITTKTHNFADKEVALTLEKVNMSKSYQAFFPPLAFCQGVCLDVL